MKKLFIILFLISSFVYATDDSINYRPYGKYFYGKSQGAKYALFDSDKNQITEMIYDEFSGSYDLIKAKKGRKIDIFYTDKVLKLEENLDSAHIFNGFQPDDIKRYYILKKDGQFAVMILDKKEGKIANQPEFIYDNIYGYKNYFFGYKDGMWKLMNADTNSQVKDITYKKVYETNNICFYGIGRYGKYGLFNICEMKTGELKYDGIHVSRDNIQFQENGEWKDYFKTQNGFKKNLKEDIETAGSYILTPILVPALILHYGYGVGQ